MKICQNHWNELRKAIDDRGLTKFVSPDGQTLIKEVKNELDGKPAKFDPLFAANIAIWSNALNAGGLYMMTGNYCPLCELEKYTEEKAGTWIKYAADEQYERAKALGLIIEH